MPHIDIQSSPSSGEMVAAWRSVRQVLDEPERFSAAEIRRRVGCLLQIAGHLVTNASLPQGFALDIEETHRGPLQVRLRKLENGRK